MPYIFGMYVVCMQCICGMYFVRVRMVCMGCVYGLHAVCIFYFLFFARGVYKVIMFSARGV